MKKVLLLATTTGYQIRSFGEAAETLGIRLVFASDRCDQLVDPWWDEAIPIRFHDELASVRAVVTAFGPTPPDGILAVGDRPVALAARLNEAFGLPGNPASVFVTLAILAASVVSRIVSHIVSRIIAIARAQASLASPSPPGCYLWTTPASGPIAVLISVFQG